MKKYLTKFDSAKLCKVTIVIVKDLEYWGVDAIWLELCCESKYAARKKFINETIEKEQAYKNACQVASI